MCSRRRYRHGGQVVRKPVGGARGRARALREPSSGGRGLGRTSIRELGYLDGGSDHPRTQAAQVRAQEAETIGSSTISQTERVEKPRENSSEVGAPPLPDSLYPSRFLAQDSLHKIPCTRFLAQDSLHKIPCTRFLAQDSLHKLTTYLTKSYGWIGIEDLNVKGMLANARLARAISDMGFHEFRVQVGTSRQPHRDCRSMVRVFQNVQRVWCHQGELSAGRASVSMFGVQTYERP